MPSQQFPIRRSLILDPVHPRDYRELTVIHCCEQCSHFAPADKSCTLGYDAKNHLEETQKRNYELYGRVAFCRFSEID
jgi:hypothetical protein